MIQETATIVAERKHSGSEGCYKAGIPVNHSFGVSPDKD